MAADAFTGPDRPLILADPTFEAIAWYAEKNGAQVVKVPLTSDYAHDLDAMVAKAPKAGALIYLCNPNNPTASLTPASKIEAFVKGFAAQRGCPDRRGLSPLRHGSAAIPFFP